MCVFVACVGGARRDKKHGLTVSIVLPAQLGLMGASGRFDVPKFSLISLNQLNLYLKRRGKVSALLR